MDMAVVILRSVGWRLFHFGARGRIFSSKRLSLQIYIDGMEKE